MDENPLDALLRAKSCPPSSGNLVMGRPRQQNEELLANFPKGELGSVKVGRNSSVECSGDKPSPFKTSVGGGRSSDVPIPHFDAPAMVAEVVDT